jgi:hypothetical protein
MRKLCIFGTHHKYQTDNPINGVFRSHLDELIQDHQVDTIVEEATGLAQKSCIEHLADHLSVRWRNIDSTLEERELMDDAALRSKYDTFQDLALHQRREGIWAVRISEAVINSGLLVCGFTHVLSLGEKLRWLDFEIEAHIYCPRRDDVYLI